MQFTNTRYPAVFGDYFKTFGSEVHFNDVTLVSDDYKQFPAHRVILSAGSQVLRKLLLINTNSQNPVLYLKGVKNDELRSVLQFLYLGECRVSDDRVNEFMKAAIELELKDFQTSSQAPGPAPISQPPSYSINSNNAQMRAKPETLLDNKAQMRAKLEKLPIFKDTSMRIAQSSSPRGPKISQNFATQSLTTESTMMKNDGGLEMEEYPDDPVPLPGFGNENNQLVQYDNSQSKEEPDQKTQLKCIICQEAFNDEAVLAKHKKKVHKNVLFHCARCRFQTKDEAMFSQHMKADHSSSNSANQTYRCVLCEFQATQPDELKVHLKTHNKRTVILNSATNSVEFQ